MISESVVYRFVPQCMQWVRGMVDVACSRECWTLQGIACLEGRQFSMLMVVWKPLTDIELPRGLGYDELRGDVVAFLASAFCERCISTITHLYERPGSLEIRVNGKA